jgi:exonuclease III
MEETNNTQVKVLASPNVVVPLGPGNRINETQFPKPIMGRNRADVSSERGRLLTPKRITTVGTWNVRTLYATGAVSMLIRELERLRWDVIGVAETHWNGIEESTVHGYKVISSGKEAGHSSGVGLILTATAQRALISYNPVSDRIITARFHTATGATTICQVYAPTADAQDVDIDAFYSDLQQEVNRTPRNDALIIMGDFNAKVGRGDEATRTIMGLHGIGERNERGDRLLDFCCANNLCITNTRFKQTKANRQWTWESPGGRTHNAIDYILVSRKLVSSVRSSRAYPSADCGSDHQLLMANIKLRLKAKMSATKNKKVDVGKLKDDITMALYQAKLEDGWQKARNKQVTDVEEAWEQVRNTIQETSKEVLGFTAGQRQKEWLSPHTLALMDQRRECKGKRKLHPDMAKHHNYLCRMVKKSAKEDKERYITEICLGVEEAREQRKTRAVYEGIRKITGKHAPQVKSIKDDQGKILTDPAAVKEMCCVSKPRCQQQKPRRLTWAS